MNKEVIKIPEERRECGKCPTCKGNLFVEAFEIDLSSYTSVPIKMKAHFFCKQCGREVKFKGLTSS